MVEIKNPRLDSTSIGQLSGVMNRQQLPQHLQGWQCPSCRVIWSPHVQACHCNSPNVAPTATYAGLT